MLEKGQFVHLHVELLQILLAKKDFSGNSGYEPQLNIKSTRISRKMMASDFSHCFPSGTEKITRTNPRNQINCCQLFLKGFVDLSREGGAKGTIKATRPHPRRSIVIFDGHQEATKAEEVKKK